MVNNTTWNVAKENGMQLGAKQFGKVSGFHAALLSSAPIGRLSQREQCKMSLSG
jgi:hypothetical protein